MKFKTNETEDTPEVTVEVVTETVKEKKPSITELHRKRIQSAFELIKNAMNAIEESVYYLANECKDND